MKIRSETTLTRIGSEEHRTLRQLAAVERMPMVAVLNAAVADLADEWQKQRESNNEPKKL